MQAEKQHVKHLPFHRKRDFWYRRKRLCLLKLLFIFAFAEELLLVLAHILMFLSMRCSCETEPCLILKVIS